MRIVPPLFLRDICHVACSAIAGTAHYSPMLHNALVGLALAFLDDSKFRDLKTRLYFIDRAKSYLEVECLVVSMGHRENKIWDSYISVGEFESQGVYLFR